MLKMKFLALLLIFVSAIILPKIAYCDVIAFSKVDDDKFLFISRMSCNFCKEVFILIYI